MTNPLITTVIPTYRRPALLKRAIQSVLAQSFTNLKICVYDNASADETAYVVSEFSRHDERVCYSRNDSNIGAVQNIIQGVNAVATEFYSLLSDDDFLLPGFYENAMRQFDRHPTVGFVCAKTVRVDLINAKLQFRNQDWSPGIYQPSNEIVAKMAISHFTQTGVLLRKEMRQLIGSFDKSGNDILYMMMAAACVPFEVLDSYGAAYIVHPQAFSAIAGVGGQDTLSLCDALLSTVENIMKLALPIERKTYLLLVATSVYNELLDSKKLSRLVAGKREHQNSEETFLPTGRSFPGLKIRLYESLPRELHQILTYCLRLVARANSMRRAKQTGAESFPLPESANEFFRAADCDVAKFFSCIQELIPSRNH